jgi:hypothetical protein
VSVLSAMGRAPIVSAGPLLRFVGSFSTSEEAAESSAFLRESGIYLICLMSAFRAKYPSGPEGVPWFAQPAKPVASKGTSD